MHLHSCEIPITPPSPKKWKTLRKKKKHVISTCSYICLPLSMLVLVESPGSPAPFSTSTIVLRAVFPPKAGGDHIDIAEDWRIGISHHINIWGYDSYVLRNRNRQEEFITGRCLLMLPDFATQKLWFESFWSILYKIVVQVVGSGWRRKLSLLCLASQPAWQKFSDMASHPCTLYIILPQWLIMVGRKRSSRTC